MSMTKAYAARYNPLYRERNRERIILKAREKHHADIEKSRMERREWARNHPEQQKAWREQNRQKCREKSMRWWASEKGLQYKKECAWKMAAARSAHKALQIMAKPKWVDAEALAKIYMECREATIRTGTPHHVDHIYPLHGKGFVGLHVPWNLQILTATENLSKGNRIKWLSEH